MRYFKKIIPIIMFMIGLGILLYPAVSQQWNAYRQKQLINDYDQTVLDGKEEDYKEVWEAAENYDKELTYNPFQTEAFMEQEEDLKKTRYWSVLNLNNDGVMGYISIPKIKQEISIYHGSADQVMQQGVGHLSGTNLPDGGNGNHCVLAAHRGLPNAKLFTDLDQMEQGDKFYLHVLNKTLAYQVDQIFPMIAREDYQALGKALSLDQNKDYVTLFTCTPYGINTHRLLIRGHRVEYHGEDEGTHANTFKVIQKISGKYKIGWITLFVLIVLILVMVIVRNRLKKEMKMKEGDS